MPSPAARSPLAFLCLTIGLGFAACYPKAAEAPPPPTPADAQRASAKWPDATEEKLAEGRGLFVAKCNACHGLPDVKAVSEAEWPSVAERMGKKANLDEKQRAAVLRFILVARENKGG